MNKPSSPKTRTKLSLSRKLALAAGALFLLLLVAWFVVSSNAFFRSFILPRVGAAMNSEITVGSAAVHPFSSVTLRKLEVKPNGEAPLLKAEEVRVRYHLWSILRGNLAVDEVFLDSPAITVVKDVRGRSNLDPLTKTRTGGSAQQVPAPSASPAKATAPRHVDVKSITIKSGSVHLTQQLKAGGEQVAELTAFDFTLKDLKNAGTAALEVGVTVNLSQPGISNAPPSTLGGTLKGAFRVTLDANLGLQTANGSADFSISRASGQFSELSALTVQLPAEITPTEIKQLALNFSKGNRPIGAIIVAGPFDAAKQEGKLTVVVSSIDRQVLNLAGAAAGLDFGNSRLDSTNTVELARGGKVIVAGQLAARSLSLTHQGLTTPALDLRSDYRATVDQAGALIESFTVDGTQSGRALVHGALAKPMKLDWASKAGAVDESSFKLSFTGLDLADWRAFAGTNVRSGVINGELNVIAQQAGRKIEFTCGASATNLAGQFGDNRIDRGALQINVRSTVTDFHMLEIAELKATVSQGAQSVANVQAGGTVDLQSLEAALQTSLDASLPGLAVFMGRPDLRFSSGALQFSGSVNRKASVTAKVPSPDQEVKGTLKLTPASGNFGSMTFDRLESSFECDIVMGSQEAVIKQFGGKLAQAGQPAGALEVKGRYQLQKQSGEVTAKLTDLNHNILRTILAPALGDKKLGSGAINAEVTVSYDPSAASAVKGNLVLTNFVVDDPSGTLPKSPLGGSCIMDLSWLKQVLDLRQCKLALAATTRAKNEVNVAGKIELTPSNLITGALKFTSDALDLTSYYDLFAGGQSKSAPAPTTTTRQPPNVSSAPEAEPSAVKFPVTNLSAQVAIGRLYLHEVDIANLQASLKFDGGHVVARPLQLSLNGAAVSSSADVDLGVPGYRYDLSLKAPGVPLAPLVNTFMPDRKGQIGGTLTADAQIKGAGTTGLNLQKNLAGQVNLESTNLNLAISNVRLAAMKDVITVIIGIPAALKNLPQMLERLGSSMGSLFTGEQNTKWNSEVSSYPIDAISVKATAGAGKVELAQASVQSKAFQANAHGTIPIAPVLSNSPLLIPVTVWMKRSLTDPIGLTPKDTPTNAAFARLPDFITVKGTLGDYKVEKNYAVLATVVLDAGVGIVNRIGSLIGLSSRPQTNSEAGTNQNQATNRPRGLLDLLVPPKSPQNK